MQKPLRSSGAALRGSEPLRRILGRVTGAEPGQTLVCIAGVARRRPLLSGELVGACWISRTTPGSIRCAPTCASRRFSRRRVWKSESTRGRPHLFHRGDTRGDSAHRRWLALVSVCPPRTPVGCHAAFGPLRSVFSDSPGSDLPPRHIRTPDAERRANPAKRRWSHALSPVLSRASLIRSRNRRSPGRR
jgi:hypothetical protein